MRYHRRVVKKILLFFFSLYGYRFRHLDMKIRASQLIQLNKPKFIRIMPMGSCSFLFYISSIATLICVVHEWNEITFWIKINTWFRARKYSSLINLPRIRLCLRDDVFGVLNSNPDYTTLRFLYLTKNIQELEQ